MGVAEVASGTAAAGVAGAGLAGEVISGGGAGLPTAAGAKPSQDPREGAFSLTWSLYPRHYSPAAPFTIPYT